MSDNSNTTDTQDVKQKNQKKALFKYSKIKRKTLRHVWLMRVLLVVAMITALFFVVNFGRYLYKSLGISNISGMLTDFVFPNDEILLSENGRVNVLVLGIGGKGHEGATLTDTILLVSVPLQKSNIEMFSVPRDIWIPEIRAKINSAYYWGAKNSDGNGTALAKSSIEQVLGVRPQYTVVVDFSGFKKIIDNLGGVDVYVEKGFTDEYYPIEGKENDLCNGDKKLLCRYETISFNPGMQHMDGEVALKFVRSRHSDSDEGTDTARQSRQQKVIEGVKNKILTKEILLNPKKLGLLWSSVMESVDTDLNSDVMATLARKTYDSRQLLSNRIIPESLLVNPPISPLYDKQYVFIPAAGNGNWGDIQKWVMGILNN